MKRIIIATLLLTTPALAESPTPETRAWQYIAAQSMLREQAMAVTVISREDQVATLTKQISDLTAELAKLKAPPVDAAH